MIVSIRIPQLGEGLQEALLIEFLKSAGDEVQRDEPIYVMETDKATTSVESPYSGKLIAWTGTPGSVLPIGTEIGKMEVAEVVKEMPAHPQTPTEQSPDVSEEEAGGVEQAKAQTQRSTDDLLIPPLTRKYLKDLGMLELAGQIPAAGKKLMPADVDRFVAERRSQVDSHESSAGAVSVAGCSAVETPYDLVELPKSQISLNYRLVRGVQACVPVTLMLEIDWSKIATARDLNRSLGGATGFAMACYAVVQAMKKHPKFRSSLNAAGNSLQVYRHVNLGIAVALPDDQMLTAVIREADLLSREQFFEAYDRSVQLAREGKDQADESTTLIVSNIGSAGMRVGIPAVVPPAVATLALGAAYHAAIPTQAGVAFRLAVMATLCFDHRIANGVGAAEFFNDIRAAIESWTT